MATNAERDRQMKLDRESGMSLSQLAKKYGISESRISMITSTVPEESNPKSKDYWPEWELWRNLNKRYGSKNEKTVDGSNKG